MNQITKRTILVTTGTEGPSHDPYGYHAGLGEWWWVCRGNYTNFRLSMIG